jgi:1-acyl-sn-glycerol-3-phosphate acyltransferase
MLLARLWLFIWRWKAVTPPAELPDKFVMIAAPHTSNWDFPLTLALAKVSHIEVSWLGKRSLFRGPMGPIMRWLGGVSVDRSAPGGMVAALVADFAAKDKLALIVPAEGTRSHAPYWKSGFYRIALEANVPVLCGFVDSTTRTGGFGPVLQLTGDVGADMDVIRAYYDGKKGLRPANVGPVRLKEEDAPQPEG